MEMEKCKVEINEIDLRFCLFHILIMVLPCAFSNVLGIYINLEWHTQIYLFIMRKTWLSLLHF
jgi:hypothetical protein